jgi:hypothetical protein
VFIAVKRIAECVIKAGFSAVFAGFSETPSAMPVSHGEMISGPVLSDVQSGKAPRHRLGGSANAGEAGKRGAELAECIERDLVKNPKAKLRMLICAMHDALAIQAADKSGDAADAALPVFQGRGYTAGEAAQITDTMSAIAGTGVLTLGELAAKAGAVSAYSREYAAYSREYAVYSREYAAYSREYAAYSREYAAQFRSSAAQFRSSAEGSLLGKPETMSAALRSNIRRRQTSKNRGADRKLSDGG